MPRGMSSPGRWLRSLGGAPSAAHEVWEPTRALYASGMYPAPQLCVRHRGRIVLDRAIGFARGAGPACEPSQARVPVELTTPFQLFSASKPLATLLVHRLDEEGELHLEDSVCEYISEFGHHRKEQATLRNLLSHRAGIPEGPRGSLRPALLVDRERLIALLCDMQPRTRPGRHLAYHAVTKESWSEKSFGA
jgi:CubicO group peptidase (beta-lactamase class C family)